MTTRLEKTLKREIHVKGQTFVVALSPEGLKLTLKGHRKGLELQWESLLSGDAALAMALNASVGRFELAKNVKVRATDERPRAPKRKKRKVAR
jgi:hypothetical protein